MTPIVTVDFQLMQGDGWTVAFPCYTVAPMVPFPLTGYGAAFSVRQNFGDAAPLLTFAIGSPTVNGSNIAIVQTVGSTILSTVQPTIRAADALFLGSIIGGSKTSKLYYNCWITPPGGDPITIAVGAFYLRTRV